MARFITNFEVIPPTKEEIEIYYDQKAKNINNLFKKYGIRNSQGEIEQITVDKLKFSLSFEGFFKSTLIKDIFFNQKQQFVPPEIIHVFRSIISEPPKNIKAFFIETFLELLARKKWRQPLSEYFEKQYHVRSDGTIILSELQDFSVGNAVYKVVFQLRTPHHERITLFLKQYSVIKAHNEMVYFRLQKHFLASARYAKKPFRLLNKENNKALLVSPLIPGISSDAVLSKLMDVYRKDKVEANKKIIRTALEILIEAFICHAVLGDLFGRNDRHLMNSFIANVIDDVPQKNTLQLFRDSQEVLAFAKAVAARNTKSFSLIDFDLAWLLGKNNMRWIFIDIDFGLSELNLLSLLDELNDSGSKMIPFDEQRKEYINRYFSVYCRKLEAILGKKEMLFSKIKKSYPKPISEEKLKRLSKKIALFEESKEYVVALFKRYLLHFRLRKAYKETLIALYRFARQSNNDDLMKALKETQLLKYLPDLSVVKTSNTSVLLELECFRGVLSKKDIRELSLKRKTSWETVAENISRIAAKFNGSFFKSLENKKRLIRSDTAALLEGLRSHTETRSLQPL